MVPLRILKFTYTGNSLRGDFQESPAEKKATNGFFEVEKYNADFVCVCDLNKPQLRNCFCLIFLVSISP